MAKKSTLILVLVLLFSFTLLMGGIAEAAYPEKPITIYVTKSLGGSVDSAIRLFRPFLEEALDTPIIVKNITASGGRVAADDVFRADPDGYTLLVAPLPSAIIGQLLYESNHDFRLFVPIYNMMQTFQTITVNADSDIYTMEDLKKLSDEQGITMAGSGGMGSNADIVRSLLTKNGFDVRMVPYPGASQAAAAVMGNHCTFSSQSSSGVLKYVEEGTLRVIAVASPERVGILPDVPTLTELGYDIVVPLTSSLFAPPGTDPEIVAVLADAFETAMEHSRFKRMQSKMDVALYAVGPEKLDKMVQENYDMVASLIDQLKQQ